MICNELFPNTVGNTYCKILAYSVYYSIYHTAWDLSIKIHGSRQSHWEPLMFPWEQQLLKLYIPCCSNKIISIKLIISVLISCLSSLARHSLKIVSSNFNLILLVAIKIVMLMCVYRFNLLCADQMTPKVYKSWNQLLCVDQPMAPVRKKV